MYVTNTETYLIHKYELKNGTYIKSGVHIPQEFETMTIKQQKSYRQKKAFNFLIWSVFHKDKFHSPIDHRVMMCRFLDLNTNIFGSLLSAYLMKRFLLQLQSPFIDFYFEDKLVTFP